MATNQKLTIKDWQNGIADSPHVGHALLQCVEVDSVSGAVRVAKQPVSVFPTAISKTFTANAATDICTTSSTVPNTDTAVTVSNSGGGLPAGLSAGTVYFIIKVSSTTFKLATTIANAEAGTAIDITSNGTGTQTVVTVNPGTIMHFAYDPRTSTKFAQDSNGRVWYDNGGVFSLLNGNTLTNAVGNGLVLFKPSSGDHLYLIAFRNAQVDIVDVFGNTQKRAPSWTNNWDSAWPGPINSTAGSGNSHYAILGQDNIVYYCDDRYIGSITEIGVFDPSNTATYNPNVQALDLPLGLTTYWLEQLGVNLLISVSNDSYIYPWDRVSDSFGLPLPLPEFGGNKMKNIGNIVYILAGRRGNIYYTLGTYVRPFKTLPVYLLNTDVTTPSSIPLTWGGIASMLGDLIVGVGALSGQSGTYRLTPDGHVTIDNMPSTSGSNGANATALFAQNDFYSMGYSGGIDKMDTSRYGSLGNVIIQSALYRVGNKAQKATYSQLEIQLASPQIGSVRVGWRANDTATFTNITTFSPDGTSTSYEFDCGLIDIENIQIQVEMSGPLELLEVRLNP